MPQLWRPKKFILKSGISMNSIESFLQILPDAISNRVWTIPECFFRFFQSCLPVTQERFFFKSENFERESPRILVQVSLVYYFLGKVSQLFLEFVQTSWNSFAFQYTVGLSLGLLELINKIINKYLLKILKIWTAYFKIRHFHEISRRVSPNPSWLCLQKYLNYC